MTHPMKAILESLFLASAKPISLGELMDILTVNLSSQEPGEAPKTVSKKELTDAIEQIQMDLEGEGHGFTLTEVAGGYQLRTKPEFAPWIQIMSQPKALRLSPSSMETLAMVAYRQPITRAEIETIRGVDSGAVLKTLLERRMIRILGKKDEPGRPLLYGTTKEFLEVFGLKDLNELPPLSEFQEKIRQQGGPASELGQGWELSALDVTAPEKLAELGEEEREAIEELDRELQNLKQVEKKLPMGENS